LEDFCLDIYKAKRYNSEVHKSEREKTQRTVFLGFFLEEQMSKLLIILTVVSLTVLSAQGAMYLEDFEQGGGGGFDPMFNHAFFTLYPPGPPWWELSGGVLWLAPARDEVTFNLAGGQYVDWAVITLIDWCGSGCTSVEFIGTLDSVTFSNTSVSTPETYDTTGQNLGEIYEIHLTSNEATFDNLGISVVPEPSTVALLGLGTLVMLRRRRK
jgi:hypothetical protein